MVKFILQNMRDRLKRAARKDKISDTDPVKLDSKVGAEPSTPKHQSSTPTQKTQSAQTRQNVADKKEELDSPNSHPNSDPPKPPPRSRRRRSRRRGKPKTSNSERAESEDAVSDPKPQAPWDPTRFQAQPVQGKTRFQDLPIPDEIMHGIADLGFSYCTPIQAEILPYALQGADAMGRAQTGTGKSAAFLISIFNHLLKKPIEKKRRRGTPRALIIAPTRELVLQIENDARNIGKYSGQTIIAVFGGMDYSKQQRMLTEQQVDIIIATPGRLLDFKRRQDLHLSKVEILVIDEADRMLDMGFIPDVRNIIHSTPPKSRRQTMLFSATLSADVIRLASQWTRDPINVEIKPEQVAVDTVEQIVYLVTTEEKFALLMNIVMQENANRVIVFANRRDQTRKLTELLERYQINTAMLSGEVAQNKRIRTLEEFREGKIRVLVATDVAGRGIHVDGVSHVINFTLPQDPEDYVHRIGRTGRAGANGISISFACESDSFQIPAIEEYIGHELKCAHPEDDLLQALPKPSGHNRTRTRKQEKTGGSSQSRRRGGRSRHRNSGKASERSSPVPKPTRNPSSGSRDT